MRQGGADGRGFAFIDRVTEEEPFEFGFFPGADSELEALQRVGRAVARPVIDHDHLNRFQKG